MNAPATARQFARPIGDTILDAMREHQAAWNAARAYRTLYARDHAEEDRLDDVLWDAAKLLAAMLRAEGIDPVILGEVT